MNQLEALLVGLIEALPAGAGGPADGVAVELSSVELAIPVEAHVDAGGRVRASLPRGRIATGYDVQLCRMALRYVREEAA